MECNLLCDATGERCWNSKALQRYAGQMTSHEAAFSSQHQDVLVQAGEISCEGVVENKYGLGKVCLPYIEPSLAIYQDRVLDLPDNVRYLREIKRFRLVKPDGSLWHKTLNI